MIDNQKILFKFIQINNVSYKDVPFYYILSEKLIKKHEDGRCEVSENAKRILITGCPSGGIVEKIIKPLEESGAVVVCFENCIGIKSFDRMVDTEKAVPKKKEHKEHTEEKATKEVHEKVTSKAKHKTVKK